MPLPGKTMTTVHSTIDVDSREFAANTAAMSALVAELRAKLEAATRGGSE